MALTDPSDFASFDGHVWLNCAHQGPLPASAARRAEEAIAWKQRPYELTSERFRDVPERLRRTLARLIGGDPDDIVLANSASYGLHLIANGMRWRAGDEVLVMDTDFPSDILPWLRLEPHGVAVRRERPRGHIFEPDEVRTRIGPKTRLLCLTWVHSFSGWAIDLHAIGQLCRAHDIVFVVNASQALGARPLDVSTAPVDAVISVGFKWLCGPYGTGFCWLHPTLRAQLDPPKAYWLSMLTPDDLEGSVEIRLKSDLGIKAFDIFGTANFLNFVPWTVSIEYLLDRGIQAIADYDQTLVSRFLDRIDRARYTMVSPLHPSRRSTLILLTHVVSTQTRAAYEALQRANVHVAMRAGSIRVSPHVYNSVADIDLAVDVLNAI
jgi:selenocysteine lyase/cysteine desulfurase